MTIIRRCDAAPAALRTASGTHVLQVRRADGFFSRFRGLMLAPPLPARSGLLITRCASVHTLLMRAAIDLVYLDAGGRVLKCVPRVRPWRMSWGGAGAKHCLELAAGTIEELDIRPDDLFVAPPQARAAVPRAQRQRGAAMVEFIIAGPMLTLLGLAIVQYGLLFFAKNQINHATFMAARAGSMKNADIGAVRAAYVSNLRALYGGGTNSAELNEALVRATADTALWTQIQLLNPTRESYDDWNDARLERINGMRTISNSGLAFRNLAQVGATSGQNIQDANLIKIRVMHGYEPVVPFMRLVYGTYMRWLDTRTDARYTAMVEAGRIPIISHATLQMQSDPREGDVVSSPGAGNGGRPTNPGDPPVTTEPPPSCATAGCTVPPGTLPQPPPCNPNTDPNGCRPPGCQAGDAACDPECGVSMCCGPL